MAAEGLVLVCGGSRSGKSRWAEHLASTSGWPVLYLATAPARPHDQHWQARLEQHRRRRPTSWSCLETGAALTPALADLNRPQHPLAGHLLLIDALGSWLAQHLEADAADWERLATALLRQLEHQRVPVLLVCEEVGLGLVAPTAIGNLFRDRMGELQQRLMAQASGSWLVVAGRALDLHSLGQVVPMEA